MIGKGKIIKKRVLVEYELEVSKHKPTGKHYDGRCVNCYLNGSNEIRCSMDSYIDCPCDDDEQVSLVKKTVIQ